MSAEHVKQMIFNWAVTLKIHPHRFDLPLREEGEVYIGATWKPTDWSISNIFEDTAATRESIVIKGRGKTSRIIHMMSLRSSGEIRTTLRSVAVTEHLGFAPGYSRLGRTGWRRYYRYGITASVHLGCV